MKVAYVVVVLAFFALAGCGRNEAPAAISMTYENYEWKKGEPRKRMIQKDEGFCTIQAFGGGYNGSGEAVRIVLDEKDGYWYLEGNSLADLTWVRAMAIRIKPIGTTTVLPVTQ